MRAVDVGGHRGKSVGKALGHEALGCQVVAFVELMFAQHVENAGIAVQTGGVELNSIVDIAQPAEAVLRLFERHAADEPMYFVSKIKQVFRQVASILACHSCNERFFVHA